MSGRGQLVRAQLVFVELKDFAYNKADPEACHSLTRGNVHAGSSFPSIVELPDPDEVLAMRRRGYRPLFELCLDDS